MQLLRLSLALLTALAPLSAAAQDGRVWLYNRHVADSPLETVLNLGYGVPESDDVQASMLCAIGANWIFAQTLLAADVDGLAADAEVTLEVQAPGYSATFDAHVVRLEEFIHGVEFALPLDDDLWGVLMAGGSLSYGVSGHARQTLPLDGAADPAHEFLGDCLSIGDLAPEGQPAPAAKT